MDMKVSRITLLRVVAGIVMEICICSNLVRGADPVLNCTVEQNGKNAKITATYCPGDKDDFFEPIISTTSDPCVVAIQSWTNSNLKKDGQDCGQQIVQVVKKKAGNATVTIRTLGGESCSTDFHLCDALFSMAIPGGINFGEVRPSTILLNGSRVIAVKTINTETGLDNTSETGQATVKLTGSTAFEFSGGGTLKTITFVNGQATITVNSVGSCNETGYFEVVDSNSPDSVGGTDVLHTARISLLTGSSIPTVSQWGLIFMGLLLLTAGAVVIARRCRTAPA
jgi:hypothetical protein